METRLSEDTKDERNQKWIFHSITHGDLIWKKPIAAKYEALDGSRLGLESKLERDFSAHLRSLDISIRTQVRCDSGIADLVKGMGVTTDMAHRLSRAFGTSP